MRGFSEAADGIRTREEWERAALSQLRAGRPERWLRENMQRGRIRLAEGRDEQLGTLVGDWWQARAELGPGQAVMLAYRRRDVAELNGRARRKGQLGRLLFRVSGGRGHRSPRLLRIP